MYIIKHNKDNYGTSNNNNASVGSGRAVVASYFPTSKWLPILSSSSVPPRAAPKLKCWTGARPILESLILQAFGLGRFAPAPKDYKPHKKKKKKKYTYIYIYIYINIHVI